MTVLVFDIGGTRLRAALYRPQEDRLTDSLRVATPDHRDAGEAGFEKMWGAVCAAMRELGDALLRGVSPEAVCVAFAGPVDRAGRLLAAPTVWGKSQGDPFPILESLSAVWPGCTVRVVNDVTAAGYRYAAPDLQDFCLVTVSSGIGNKVFLRGSPVTGPRGRGGEIGHLCVDYSDNALRCDCSMSGHLGAVASGRGALTLALSLAREAPQDFAHSSLARGCEPDRPAFDAEALAAAFRAGDAWAARVIDRAAAYLGYGLAAIHTAIGIERFILIGGFAFGLGEPYRKRVADAAARSCWDLGEHWDSMLTLGIDDDDSGLLGAGRYAMTQRVG